MPSTGTVKSFNPAKGWGFIDCCGVDVFVHVKYCVGGQPAVGDEVTFDIEKNPKCPEQPQAKNVRGCSAQRADEVNKQLIADMLGMGDKPEEEVAKGAFEGIVRAYNPAKGFGFIEPAMYRQPVLLRAVDCQREPKVGDKVNFDVEPVKLEDGTVQLKAINVSSERAGDEEKADGKGYGPVMERKKGSGKKGSQDTVKSTSRIRGVVHSWITERGWGFATIPGCTDIFVHSHHCIGGFIPNPGDVLEFELEKGKKKDGTINFTAINVTMATPHAGAMGPKPAQNIVPLGIKRMMGKVRHGDPTAFGA